MIPRQLKIDFTDVPLGWAKDPVFSAFMNSSSLVPTQTEPFLNQVMVRILKGLPDGRDALKSDIAIFVKQETNHYRLHAKFNKVFYERGYEHLRPIEAELHQDFEKILMERSLRFAAAYCAGFENLALLLCRFMFEKAIGMFDGGEPRMVALFKWHYAEEFEHRRVAHEAFASISGNYFVRLYGLFYSFVHLNRFSSRLFQAVLSTDRQVLSESERLLSIRREKAFTREMALFLLPRALKIMLPFYDPGRERVPENVQAILDQYERTPSLPGEESPSAQIPTGG